MEYTYIIFNSCIGDTRIVYFDDVFYVSLNS